MCHEIVSMDFFERSILVSEVASLAVWAKFFSVELSTILGLVLIVEPCCGFGDPVNLCEFLRAMGILALQTISAEANLSPVLAHFSFVFLGLC